MSFILALQNTNTSRLNPFYGYPPELIARWCGVSLGTAKHFKTGRRKPSKRVLMLFRLHADKRILGPEWKGWSVKGEKLYGPNGKPVSAGLLEIWEIVWQLALVNAPEETLALLDRLRSA